MGGCVSHRSAEVSAIWMYQASLLCCGWHWTCTGYPDESTSSKRHLTVLQAASRLNSTMQMPLPRGEYRGVGLSLDRLTSRLNGRARCVGTHPQQSSMSQHSHWKRKPWLTRKF